METDREEQGKIKEDAKCIFSPTISQKFARVPHVQIKDRVWTRRPGIGKSGWGMKLLHRQTSISLMLRYLPWFLTFSVLVAVSALETANTDGYVTTSPELHSNK